MNTKMAENSKGGILEQAGKILRRRKTKVLQSLGKTGKTTDEQLTEDIVRLERQLEVGNRFQKDLRNYLQHARALSLASKTFYTTVTETYEAEWDSHAQVAEILTSMDMLWQDYIQKLQDQVQDPLAKYLTHIPQIKSRVSKRGRKLIDYDNAKHGLDVQENAKKKDDARISKAKEDLENAKKIYEDLNNELHEELPEFYNSRLKHYGDIFENLFSAESCFHTESGKVWETAPDCDLTIVGTARLSGFGEQLATANNEKTYTPRKNLRNTIIVGEGRRDRGDSYRDSLLIPFFSKFTRKETTRESHHRSDENLTNGHSESGQSGPDSPSPTSTPTSPGGTQTPLVNGAHDTDTSKDSIEDESYENTEFPEAPVTKETKPEPSTSTTATEEVTGVKGEGSTTDAEVKVVAEDKVSEDVKMNVETDVGKMNGDLDTSTSTEPDVPDDAPPPPPASPPPGDNKDDSCPSEDKDVTTTPTTTALTTTTTITVDDDDKKASDDDDDDDDSDLYQVPPPAKPINNECLPPNYLYTVTATHTYKGEDDDELSFDSHEVIYVSGYDDPEEQKQMIVKKKTDADPGWLFGTRKCDGQKGVFPENFTKRVCEKE